MYFQRKRRGYVAVYFYDQSTGKPRPISRKITSYLDDKTDDYIRAWMQENAPRYEKSKNHPEAFLWADETLSKYINRWLTFLRVEKRRAPSTIFHMESALRNHIVPYYLSQVPPVKDPQLWPTTSINIHNWLIETRPTLSRSSIVKICQTLKRFYNYLGEENLISAQAKLTVRTPAVDPEEDETPLKFVVSPEDVYVYVDSAHTPELKLLALIGYFFSLRPQETFMLRPELFRAGSLVNDLEASRAMIRARLYNKFAVNVQKQRRQKNTAHKPKSKSRGWVCCFEERAAREILKIIKTRPLDKPLFGVQNDQLFKWWRFGGMKDVTLKDLRRASLYWLGHESKMRENPIDLMKHARHARFETTQLYLRRPTEELENTVVLDLDA